MKPTGRVWVCPVCERVEVEAAVPFKSVLCPGPHTRGDNAGKHVEMRLVKPSASVKTGATTTQEATA